MFLRTMPEYPDIEVYFECLETRVLRSPLVGSQLISPFLLRTVTPTFAVIEGQEVKELYRIGKPCRGCGDPIQRIRYASNETNYCPRCQTGGKLLADRSLTALLRKDWPKTLEELEALKRG